MSKATLFIPDISGFTKFVKSTEILHSKHIIEELINIIIEKGSDHFKVAEIEGDAVFFYADAELPPDKVVSIAKKIYIAFHQHLLRYAHDRICNCGACSHAVDLKLKFITHSGEISFAKFGSQKAKPYGDAVIEAHRLLKNEIDTNQYLLLSTSFLGDSSLAYDGEGVKYDESIGEIPFKYLGIDHWKSEVVIDKKEFKKDKVDLEVRRSSAIPLSHDVLYQFISDFRYRHFWNHEATKIIYDENAINQSGTEHLCIVKGRDFFFNTIKPEMQQEGLSYGEILKNPSPMKYFETNFFLRPNNINETELTFVMKVSVKWKIQLLLLPMIKKQLKRQASKTINEINQAVYKHADLIKASFASEAENAPPAVTA